MKIKMKSENEKKKNQKNSILVELKGIKYRTSKEISLSAWQKLKQKCIDRNVKKCMGSCRINSWTMNVNWTYIRHSEDVQDVFRTSYVRSIYFLCPGGKFNLLKLVCNIPHSSYHKQHIQKKIWSFKNKNYIMSNSTLSILISAK